MTNEIVQRLLDQSRRDRIAKNINDLANDTGLDHLAADVQAWANDACDCIEGLVRENAELNKQRNALKLEVMQSLTEFDVMKERLERLRGVAT